MKVFWVMERMYGCDEGKGEEGGWMRVADINMTMRSVQQDSERSQTQENPCVEVKVHAALVDTTFTSHGLQYS